MITSRNPARCTTVAQTGKFCYPTPVRKSGVFSTTPNTVAVTSVTSTGTTATVTTTAAHGLVPGNDVTISGAVQTAYNGMVTVLTVPTTTTFTYAVITGQTSPATGTIVVDKGGCRAVGTGTLAGTEFNVDDWIYDPSQNAVRRVKAVSTPTNWEFYQNFPSNVSGAVVNKVASGVYNSIGCKNVGGADGIFNEATIPITYPEIVFADVNALTPVAGDGTGTTLLIAAQQYI